MSKLTDWGCAAEGEYLELKRQIDRLPDMKTLLFDCELSPGCAPAKAEAGLYRDGAGYAMFIDRPFRYSGSNSALRGLMDGEPVLFEDYAMMRRFFRELSLESEPSPAPGTHTPAQDEDDFSRIVDMDKITLPTEAAQAVYDYKDIQRELEKIVIGQEAATETIAYQT